jgi:hypothetical protein
MSQTAITTIKHRKTLHSRMQDPKAPKVSFQENVGLSSVEVSTLVGRGFVAGSVGIIARVLGPKVGDIW